MGPPWLTVLSCLPIALFSETLRVQAAMVESVMTQILIAPGLTGCVKDLRQLWDIDISDVLGDFSTRRSLQVISMRHGSSFALANRGVLEVMGMLRTGRQQTSSPFNQRIQHARPTTLHITLVAPRPFSSQPNRTTSQTLCASQLVTAAEIILASSIAIILGFKHIYVGSILMACVLLNTLLLLIFRILLKPVFANEQAIARDARVTCLGGAALDIHLIAPTWNSSQINVVCGYSSQVHSLTNLPILIDSPNLVKWCCRALAVNLIVQAAALTSQVNSHSIQVWGSIVWMLFYLIMLVPSYIMKRLYSGTILEDHLYFIRKLPPLQFSRRRSALAFLAMLPVDWNTDRWDWMDSFLPSNKRRQSWILEMEKSPLIEIRSNSPPISPSTAPDLSEAVKAYMSPDFQRSLGQYKSMMGWVNRPLQRPI